jgi:uncharacterized protein (TIGR03790 family)
MRFRVRIGFTATVLLISLLPSANAAALPLNQRVLVVYDPNVSDSVNVANHYLQSRSIPAANLCAISPSETNAALTWASYVSSVKTPVQNCLNRVGQGNILYIVLAYIRPFSLRGQNGFVYSLDGYLADIWDQYSNRDAFPYPAGSHAYFGDAESQGNYYSPFIDFAAYRAQQGSALIYSVWRLDGATSALAENLVDQAIAAEGGGLNGQTCFDRQYGAMSGIYDYAYGGGDWDLHQAATFTGQAGFAVTEDSNPQEFGTPPAPNCYGAAMYSGWYHLNHYNDAFSWNTGAIGFHLDSLSAADPRAGSNWAANAIKKGITVTSGAMAEPYLDGLAHPDGVFLNLLQGANVGDAFLRNEMWLKWMILNIGDPLYRPFPGGKPPFNGPNPQDALLLTPQYPVGPVVTTGTVILANPAPPGGTVVNLSSANPSVASVPPSVTVPQGQTRATFNISTTRVNTSTKVLITATGGINKTNTIGVVPLLGGIATIAPTIIGGGSLSTAVVLDQNAPQGGTIVALSSSNPAIAPVPANVTVPAGTDRVLFSIPTVAVSSSTPVTFTASLLGARAVASIHVTPVLSSITLGTTNITGGNSDTGRVVLTGPAYHGGIVVNLSSSNPAVARVPANVTVPEGASNTTFTVTTSPVSTITHVTLTASSGQSVKTIVLTVNPPAITSLTLSPGMLRGGQNSTGTVTLNGVAPQGGSSVSLSSSNPAVAQVPSSVTVPAGSNRASFTITTTPVQTRTLVTITATYNGTRNQTLTVNP